MKPTVERGGDEALNVSRKTGRAALGTGRRAGGLLLLISAALTPYLFLVHRLWFLTDDAFISFRYAHHWASGMGLRFNPGEQPPVEGFSNFLWTAILAGIERLGGDLVAWAPWISLAAGLALLLLLTRTLLKDLGVSPGAAFMGLLAATLSPALTAWSTGGLETMLFTLLLFLVFRDLLVRRAGPAPWRAGLTAGLLTLIRPEGLLWAVGLAGLFLVRRDPDGVPLRRRLGMVLAYLAVVLVLFLPYLVFRGCYFGELVPNTVLAKAGDPGMLVERGFLYTASYLVDFVTPAVLILLAPLCFLRGGSGGARSAVLATAGCMLYGIASGGDFMTMGRFLVPTVPFLAVVAGGIAHRYLLPGGQARPGPVAVGVGILAIQLLPAFGVEPAPQSLQEALKFRWNSSQLKSELDQWRQMKRNLEDWTVTGKALAVCTKPGDTYVTAAIGAVGYHSHLVLLDQCGLVDREVASRPVPEGERRSAGHDRYVEPEFFLDRRPVILRALVVPARQRQATEANYEQSLPEGYVVRTRALTRNSSSGQGRRGQRFLVMQRLVEK